MKRLPSLGFVFLAFVLMFFCAFLYWANRYAWYDRIHSPKQGASDVEKWASYLEEIAVDFPVRERRPELLRNAAQLRFGLNQKEMAEYDLSLAERVNATGKQPGKAVRVGHAGSKSDGAVKLAKERLAQRQCDRETISVLADYLSEHRDEKLRSEFMDVLQNADISGKRVLADGRVTMIGFTPDLWTLNGKPGLLLIQASPEKGFFPQFSLGCYAKPDQLPLTATIGNEVERITRTFHQPENKMVVLPEIAAGHKTLFIINTDKAWYSKECGRNLGVRIVIE